MSEKKIPQIFSHRYEILQDLGEGGIGKVYKALDRWLNKYVALKVLTMEAENPSFVEDFQREFLLLSQLKHPGVVEVLDFGYSELLAQTRVPPSFEHKDTLSVRAGIEPPPGYRTGGAFPYFTMEFVEGKNLPEEFVDFADPILALTEFKKLYRLTWQICDVLEFLHLRGIVHGDLKPDNLKVTDKIFRPKILDFGLSENMGSKREKETKGTLPYMAPEMFKDEPLDERTDLYSLGVILYELVTSQLPFHSDDPLKIISGHLEQKPVSPSELNPHLPHFLNELIMKLLEKSPADRPRNATSVKETIEAAFPRDFKEMGKMDFSPEKIHLAYLYSGPLVEREIELAQLEDGLKPTTTSPGSCVYLSGEQGVGKTFLLKHLKMKCQLQGIILVDADCLENQTLAYQPLIEILRKLEPYVENRASAPVAQNLRDIFGRSKESSSASLEIQTFHQKIGQLLVEISQALPLVIILENLQWADLPTLKFLEHFQKQIVKGKIFLVCTVREEKLQDLTQLQSLIKFDSAEEPARYLRLNRFDLSQTQKLILSKFTRQEFPEEFFTYVHERTSGNPFFIIEVLRYLLENDIIFLKDSIWISDANRLKESAIPDSMEAVLLKNLERYQKNTLDFLNVLAVIGKRFSHRLVKELNLLDEKTLLETLWSLTNDHLLMKKEEFTSERRYYEFANQSLQSLLYQRWDKDQRIFWHKKVGELLRAHHPLEHEESVFEIAHHFYEAGELDLAYKYALLSAKKMERRFANQEVLRYLENVINLASRFSDRQKAVEKQVVALMKRANFCRKTGELDQAELDCRATLSLMEGSPNLKRLAKTYSILAEIYRQKHDYKKGIFYVEKAMEMHQKIDDPLGLAYTLSFAGLLYWTDSQYQKALELFQKVLEIDRTLANKKYEASTLNNMGLIYWSQHQYSQALKCFEDALSVYRALDNKEWIARCLNNMGDTFLHLGEYRQAIDHLLKSLEINEKSKNEKESALNLENLGETFQKMGEYDNAIKYNERGLELARRIGLYQRVGHISKNMGMIHFELGYYQESMRYIQEAQKIAEVIEDKELQILLWLILSKFHSLLNDVPKAEELLEKATQIINTINDESSWISVYQIKSWLKRQNGELDEALNLLDEALVLAKKLNGEEDIFSLTLDYAELYLDLGDIEKSKEFLNQARNSGLERYVLYQPSFYMISGRIEWISGNLNSAQNHFETAIGLAKKLNNLEMMWRIHHHLGKLFLSSHNMERAYQEFEKAGRILKQLAENIEDEELKQNYLKDQKKQELLSDLKQVAKELIGVTKMV